MTTLDNYFGIQPFTVLVDDSPQLRELAGKARELKGLPFPQRLQAVKKLALDAMINAYEEMMVWGDKAQGLQGVTVIGSDGKPTRKEYEEAKAKSEKYQNIVFQGHPLSHALEQKAGCCRYQGALFFVLGYEANLGDQHFVQAAPVNKRANTVFNHVVQDGQTHLVSVFTESLKDKRYDYSVQNPRVFEQAFETFPGLPFYSYHRTPNGFVLVTNPDRHIKEIKQ